MPKWRNWQTRYVQGVVSLGLMRVQIPPSALTPHQNWGVFCSQCLTSIKWYNICNLENRHSTIWKSHEKTP